MPLRRCAPAHFLSTLSRLLQLRLHRLHGIKCGLSYDIITLIFAHQYSFRREGHHHPPGLLACELGDGVFFR